MTGTADSTDAANDTSPPVVTGTPSRALEEKSLVVASSLNDPPQVDPPFAVVIGTGASTLAPQPVPPAWLDIDLNTKRLGGDAGKAPVKGSGGKQVQLYGFRVFGASFDGAAPGINRLLAQKLVTLQKNLYGIARSQSAKDLNEDAFLGWLWEGKPLTSGAETWELQTTERITYVTPGGIQRHKGCHNKGGGDYHSTGSAIDINYDRNGWVPLPLPERAVGEVHGPWTQAQLWDPCFDIYDRAAGIISGESSATITLTGSGTDFNARLLSAPETSVRQFRRLSNWVRKYFQLAYADTFPGLAWVGSVGHHGLLTIDEFRNNIRALGDVDSRPDPTHIKSGPGFARRKIRDAKSQNGDDGFENSLFAQLMADYLRMQLGMVIGSVTFDPATKLMGVSGSGVRYPQHGLINHRDEMLVEALKVGLVWGGASFPGWGGDVQHFDIREAVDQPGVADGSHRQLTRIGGGELS